jgi:hypothetical protein
MNKTNTLKNSTKLIFRSAIIFFILFPALMIMVPACNPFGKCGKPGFDNYGTTSCSNYHLNWSCSSPCEPSIASMTLNITYSPYYSQTVYCEDSGSFGYDTSEGIQAKVTGCP